MASLVLLQSIRISVDSSFVDYLIIGVYFAFTIAMAYHRAVREARG